MVVKTPSGFQITIKDFVPYKVDRAIQKAMMKGAKFAPLSQDKTEKDVQVDFDPSAIMDSEDIAVQMLIDSIEVAGKVYTQAETDFVALIGEWKKADAKPVYDAINTLTKQETEEKKRTETADN